MTQSYRPDSCKYVPVMTPRGSQRELQTFPLLSTAAEVTVKTELRHFFHPPNSVDLSWFFLCVFFLEWENAFSGINNPLKCHHIPAESPRELRPRAGGTGMLTLDIKLHFISYHGVTTTPCDCGSLKCHSQNAGL